MSKWILVVDDEDEIRDVIQASLEEFAGWQTITATSGIEGLQVAKTESLDAILLDISMPDMDGFQLLEQLKADAQTQKIPIIILTAKVLPNDQQQFSELDVAGVISKPFDPITVCNEVTKLLGWDVQGRC